MMASRERWRRRRCRRRHRRRGFLESSWSSDDVSFSFPPTITYSSDLLRCRREDTSKQRLGHGEGRSD